MMTFTKLFLLLFLFIAIGCESNKEELSSFANHHQFDLNVIEKLPVYDSLATAILKDYPLFLQKIKEKEAYQAYRYKPGSIEMDGFNKLPNGVSPNIKYYYAQLGQDFINGFDLYKDSSIKIYIRTQPNPYDQVDIQEHLSYYPLANKMRKREFPIKDTVLSKHWQYWIRFNPQDLF